MVAVPNQEEASKFSFEMIYSTLNSHDKENALLYLMKDSYFRMFAVENRNEENVYWLRTLSISADKNFAVESIKSIKRP